MMYFHALTCAFHLKPNNTVYVTADFKSTYLVITSTIIIYAAQEKKITVTIQGKNSLS